MNEFLSSLTVFFQSQSIWVYAFIFFGKIIEVSVSTFRIVLINRGERLVGTIVAFFEIIIWLTVTGTVLTGFQSDFRKIIVFAIAFAIGNFIGSWLDEKLAFGLSSIQVVVPNKQSADNLSDELRKNGFGVTVVNVHGREDDRLMLLITLKRKMAKQAMEIINRICTSAVVTISDVKSQKGGYFSNGSRLFK